MSEFTSIKTNPISLDHVAHLKGIKTVSVQAICVSDHRSNSALESSAVVSLHKKWLYNTDDRSKLFILLFIGKRIKTNATLIFSRKQFTL